MDNSGPEVMKVGGPNKFTLKIGYIEGDGEVETEETPLCFSPRVYILGDTRPGSYCVVSAFFLNLANGNILKQIKSVLSGLLSLHYYQ